MALKFDVRIYKAYVATTVLISYCRNLTKTNDGAFLAAITVPILPYHCSLKTAWDVHRSAPQ
jgi:hypothetical protein